MTTQDERLMRLWREGLAASVIGERLGISIGSVYEKIAALRRAGHPLPPRKKKEEQR